MWGSISSLCTCVCFSLPRLNYACPNDILIFPILAAAHFVSHFHRLASGRRWLQTSVEDTSHPSRTPGDYTCVTWRKWGHWDMAMRQLVKRITLPSAWSRSFCIKFTACHRRIENVAAYIVRIILQFGHVEGNQRSSHWAPTAERKVFLHMVKTVWCHFGLL